MGRNKRWMCGTLCYMIWTIRFYPRSFIAFSPIIKRLTSYITITKRKKFTINLLFNIFCHSSSNTHNSSLNSTFCNSLYNYFPHLRLYYVQTNNYYFFLLFRVMLPALYNPAPRTQLTHYVSAAASSTSPSASSTPVP